MTIPWPRFVSSVEGQAFTLLGLRIFVGLLLMYREGLNAAALFYDQAHSWRFVLPLVFVCVGIFLVAGVATRLWYVLLALLYIHYNFVVGVMNLGPLLFAPLFWVGATLDRSPRCSLDAALMPRSPAYRRVAQWPGPGVSLETWNFVLGILFVVYAVNSLAALNYHLRDEYWRRGLTVHAMLTNNFISVHFEVFRSIEAWSPRALFLFSAASVVVQTVFQALMLPLVFHRWGRWFVVLQGFAFFLFSFGFLQISILPLVELATWTLVFGSWALHGHAGATTLGLRVSLARGVVLAVIAAASTLAVVNSAALAMGTSTRYFGSSLERAVVCLSIWPPDVFNRTDLRMGETWYVIYRLPRDGSIRQRVPVFSEQGKRLSYHLSDVIYFGNTLFWRRASIAVTDWEAIPEYLLQPVERLCRFDFRVNGFRAPQRYVVNFYRDRSMHMDLPPAERYERRLLAVREFEVAN